MICQNCDERQASVRLTKIVNGQKEEVFLCEQCAREKGELNFVTEPFSFHNLLAGIFQGDLPSQRNFVRQEEEKCEKCNMSFSEFGKAGRFGCSECYNQFNPRLAQLMRRVHGSEQHTGKLPKRCGGSILIQKEIKELREEQQHAIANEDFERAAEIRDRIHELEKQKQENGGGDE